jgi:hypothetical protein
VDVCNCMAFCRYVSSPVARRHQFLCSRYIRGRLKKNDRRDIQRQACLLTKRSEWRENEVVAERFQETKPLTWTRSSLLSHNSDL